MAQQPATAASFMKVFVQRDYSEGTTVKFQTRFPQELESRVSFLLIKSIFLLINDNFMFIRLTDRHLRQQSTN